jgi:hypothetical protein
MQHKKHLLKQCFVYNIKDIKGINYEIDIIEFLIDIII